MEGAEGFEQMEAKEQRWVIAMVAMHAFISRSGGFSMDQLVDDSFAMADLMIEMGKK